MYFLIFISSLLLTYLVRKIALKKAIIDIPNERSSHTIPTPRGGGLAIAITWFGALIILFAIGKIEKSLFYALIPGVLLSTVSFFDDVIDLKPKTRLFFQLVTAMLGWSAILLFSDLKLMDPIQLLIVTGFAIPIIMWFINLFNFMDGSDGFLGMEGIFYSIALYLFTQNTILLIFALSIAGFLCWNWPKAKIFCGDVGSTLIGYNIAIFAVYFYQFQLTSIAIPLALSALFWIDATVTLFRRLMNKEQLTRAHRKHAYQRLIQTGFSHLQVLLVGIVINAIILLAAYSFNNKPFGNTIITISSIAVMIIYLFIVERRKKFETK